jgi:hypothetical protein
MCDLDRENDRLRLENERLMALLADCSAKMLASADYWRTHYMELARARMSASTVRDDQT